MRVIAGGLSGTAAQDEQRIGRGLQPQRRDDRDVQLQFFAVGVVAILPHPVVTAPCSGAAAGQRALQTAVGKAQRLVGKCGTDCAAKYPCH
jgi:hypothetical protein